MEGLCLVCTSLVTFDALEGFFDKYGNPIVDTEEPVEAMDGEIMEFGARRFLKNERDALKHDARELNEFIRQFPFTTDEAFRDSVEGSLFNIGKIYEQIEHNDTLFPDPVVRGNFVWRGGIKVSKVVFNPDAQGRWYVSWMPTLKKEN